MEIIKKNTRLFIILLILAGLLFILSLLNSVITIPKIVSVYPPNNSVNLPLDQKFIFIFEKPINKSKIDVVFIPEVKFVTRSVGTTIEIVPLQGLSVETKYVLIIRQKFLQKTFYEMNFSTLPSQGNSFIVEEINKSTKEHTPLAPFSPPDDAPFYFIYTGSLKINVYLIGDKKIAQNKFEEWVKSKGVDLSIHQIQYLSPP